MNPLQYTSEEMFSSTELIRKSKMVFDKLNKSDIEKAVILRDGKPAFMLLDFFKYEEMMSEYLALKNFLDDNDKKPTIKKEVKKKENIIEDEKIPEVIEEKTSQKKEIDEKDLEEALAEIDNLDLNAIGKEEKISKKSLKEFWE